MTDETRDPDLVSWLAIREQEGRNLDPETAEVFSTYGIWGDPYGIKRHLPSKVDLIARLYFARSPGSEIWVDARSIPDELWEQIWHKHRSKMELPVTAFPSNDHARREGLLDGLEQIKEMVEHRGQSGVRSHESPSWEEEDYSE